MRNDLPHAKLFWGGAARNAAALGMSRFKAELLMTALLQEELLEEVAAPGGTAQGAASRMSYFKSEQLKAELLRVLHGAASGSC